MTNTLALVADGKARLIRPRKGKGSPTEVFVQFLVPDGADDDIVTRLTFGITEAYADAEQAIAAAAIAARADLAPAPSSEPAVTGGKRPGRKKGGVILSAKDINEYLFKRGAFKFEDGVPEDEVVDRFADRADRDVVLSRVRSCESPSHGHMFWRYHPSEEAEGRVKRLWLTPDAIAKITAAAGVPQPEPQVVTHDHMALADGGVPWGGGERPVG